MYVINNVYKLLVQVKQWTSSTELTKRNIEKMHLFLGYGAALFAIFAGNATSDDAPDHNIE